MAKLLLSSQQWKELFPGVWALGPRESGPGLLYPVRATQVILQGRNGGAWRIDAGPDSPEEPLLPRHGLLTHSHPDHFYGMPPAAAESFWISKTNCSSWSHESYVTSFWRQYAGICDLGKGINREECLRHFPLLKALEQEMPWTQALLETLRLRCRQLHESPPSLESTADLEDLPLVEKEIHGTPWKGWDFGDLFVIPVRGHAPDHVVAFWEPTCLWILGDELSAVPVWPDSNPWRSALFRQRLASVLPDYGWVLGGHQNTMWGGSLARHGLLRINQIWEEFLFNMNHCRDIDRAYESWLQKEPAHPILRKQVPHALLFAKQFMANLVLQSTPADSMNPWMA